MPVPPWNTQEAIDYLRTNIDSLGAEDAAQIAAALGNLPLALAYAEAWLKRGYTADGFLNALRANPRAVLGAGGPDRYPGSLIDRIDEARETLAATDRWIAHLLNGAALLGPTPLPARSIRPRPLYRPVDDTLSTEIVLGPGELSKAFPVLGKSGLSSFCDARLRVSPVYCATVRGLLSQEEMRQAARSADVLLMALDPRGTRLDRRVMVERWKPVLSSFLARDPHEATTGEVLGALAAAYDHMTDLGRWREVLARMETLYRRGLELFTQDNAAVLGVGDVLQRAYTSARRYADAVQLGTALRECRLSLHGAVGIDTLRCSSALIIPLGSGGHIADAVELAQETLLAQTTRLGADNPDTLLTQSRRAVAERMAGRWRDAVAIGEAVRMAQQRVLGREHPDVLSTGYELACAYRNSVVHTEDALHLFTETLHSQGQVLGDDHPATARTAVSLELMHVDVYGTLRDAERCGAALERLRREFGAEDRDVDRLEQIRQAWRLS
ncbi:tetratricopeptide repeat protein [Streptomyces sp. 71268]|uniref:tetratricopeptide repeat protein n=1 Tax=Streptomyces sp. 71268 TaxID=3002640 RepID=UPI0023FA2C2E|nr:tetratricopeptide repeat protein [Streptomyces sp. 71268]WEV24915.1 tetratricopeptide repeat protein [Streptomyces sp. 71268]